MTFRVGIYPGFVENGILDCAFLKELRTREDIIAMGLEFKAELDGHFLVVSVRVKQDGVQAIEELGHGGIKDNLFKFFKNNLVK